MTLELMERFDIHKVKFGNDLNALRDSGIGQVSFYSLKLMS